MHASMCHTHGYIGLAISAICPPWALAGRAWGVGGKVLTIWMDLCSDVPLPLPPLSPSTTHLRYLFSPRPPGGPLACMLPGDPTSFSTHSSHVHSRRSCFPLSVPSTWSSPNFSAFAIISCASSACHSLWSLDYFMQSS